MNKDEKLLWEKITHFKFDDDSVDFRFSHRLARENNWSLKYAEDVIEEYKKFIFLCCLTKVGVTPSDQVDQVWHLHLTFTKSYWIDFCQKTLEKEIHHNPTKGGIQENKKFDDFYTQTKEEYRRLFNSEPPLSIWPDNQNRFSDINFKRINIDKNWVIKKPTFKQKNNIKTILAIMVSVFFIQASFIDKSPIIPIALILVFLIILYIKNKDGNGNNNGQGCSGGTGSCSGGCSSHSGCSSHGGDSGCGSGCSGCGGGCGN